MHFGSFCVYSVKIDNDKILWLPSEKRSNVFRQRSSSWRPLTECTRRLPVDTGFFRYNPIFPYLSRLLTEFAEVHQTHVALIGFTARCLEALGMADGTIADNQLSASSYWFFSTRPELGRPGLRGWLPDISSEIRRVLYEEDYFQVNIRSIV